MNKKEKYLSFRAIAGSPADKIFTALLVAGLHANQAFILAYSTKANVNSAVAMASRKVNSWEIQSMLKTLQSLYVRGEIDFPHQLIKE